MLLLVQPQAFGHPYKVGQGFCPHLPHDLAAMDLDRDLAEAKLGGYLLVNQPRGDQRHHLALAHG